MRTIATITMAALLATPTFAQDSPKPGPEHEALKQREGAWTTLMKAGGMEYKGSVNFKMELSGLWLAGTLDSELFGMKFSGKSLDGYDPIKKKFVSIWVDSMSTAPVIMEGTYDKEKKTLTMTGEGPGMDRKTTKYKSVTTYPDENTLEMTMYIGEGKDPAFTITYSRKK